ncbi:MAG TPA: folylpolyglutamate synthase/dihydrofolate synthase family protein [Thermomicrobiales bacterium]|nr:folylpolyglutamate synthase/dihydrofolate synthase family protein [Thermomicrobiales bacterium]
MTSTTSYQDALAAIWARSGYDRGFISNPFAGDEAARLGLLRTQGVLDRLGNPERDYRIVHVAGSKGKGSTTVTIDSILRATGQRVGRFTSPHLHSYRERIIIQNELISEADFAEATVETMRAVDAFERESPALGEVTAWELSTAMALLWFSRAACDYAVVEVGMGGTLDATNIVTPVVSVITRLDFEHTAILGDTLPEIAANKAGIIKPGVPVVSAAQREDALAVILTKAAGTKSQVFVEGRDFDTSGSDASFSFTGPWGSIAGLHTLLAGQHQVENASLAIAATMAIEEVGAEEIRQALLDVTHPGRFEEITLPGGVPVVIDGAHSPVAARALVQTIRERHPNRRVLMVLGMLQDKDAANFVPELAAIVDKWLLAPPASPRAQTAAAVREAVETTADVATFESVAEAIAAARSVAAARDMPLIVVTGSLTTVAEARVTLGLAHNDPAPTSAPRVS